MPSPRSWLAFSAALAALASPAFAQRDWQDYTSPGRLPMDYRTAKEYVMEGKDYAASKKSVTLDLGTAEQRLDGVLNGVLVHMNCAGSDDVGPAVASLYRETPTVTLRLGEVKGIAKTVTLRDGDSGKVLGHMVSVASGLPASPRVLAIALAREAFRIKYADMPDCAEKRAMEASFVTRAWLELGGSGDTLPVIDPDNGYKNSEMEGLLKVGLKKRYYEAVAAIVKAGKVKDLQTLLSESGAKVADLDRLEADRMDNDHRTHHPDAEIEKAIEKLGDVRGTHEKLDKAVEVHVEFRMSELQWDQLHPGRRN